MTTNRTVVLEFNWDKVWIEDVGFVIKGNQRTGRKILGSISLSPTKKRRPGNPKVTGISQLTETYQSPTYWSEGSALTTAHAPYPLCVFQSDRYWFWYNWEESCSKLKGRPVYQLPLNVILLFFFFLFFYKICFNV